MKYFLVSTNTDASMQGICTFLGIAAILSPVLLEDTDWRLLMSKVRACPGFDSSYFVVFSTDRKLSEGPRAEPFLLDRNMSLCFICGVIFWVKSEIPVCRGLL